MDKMVCHIFIMHRALFGLKAMNCMVDIVDGVYLRLHFNNATSFMLSCRAEVILGNILKKKCWR